jgi:plastocyanin
MHHRLLIATALLLPVLVGCPSNQPTSGTPVPGASPTPAANTPNSIVISGFAFAPPTLTVPVGTSVTWINNDVARHTATADDLSFDTGDLPPGRNYVRILDKAGTYPYHCNFHPAEKGTVIVR